MQEEAQKEVQNIDKEKLLKLIGIDPDDKILVSKVEEIAFCSKLCIETIREKYSMEDDPLLKLYEVIANIMLET